MNAASQLLRILAIVGALAAGALYYLSTKGGSSFLSTGGSMSTQLADAQTKLTAAVADKTKDEQALADATADSNLADKARADAVAALNEDQKKFHDMQTADADKDTQIADLTTKAGSLDDLQKQISDLKDQNAKLQQQIEAGPKEPVAVTTAVQGNNAPSAQPTVTAPASIQLTPAAPAKIVAIDTKNWLMVLKLDSNDGVQKDSQLQLKVGDVDIGSVVVRDNPDGLTTAAITSTGGISPEDYAKIVTKNLNVQYQRVM